MWILKFGRKRLTQDFENLVKYSIKNLPPVWGMIFISKPMAKPLGYTVYDNRKCSPMQNNVQHTSQWTYSLKKKILKQKSLYRMYLPTHSQKEGSFFQHISFLQPWALKISFFFRQVLVTMKELPKGAPLGSWWVGARIETYQQYPAAMERFGCFFLLFLCDWTFQGFLF